MGEEKKECVAVREKFTISEIWNIYKKTSESKDFRYRLEEAGFNYEELLDLIEVLKIVVEAKQMRTDDIFKKDNECCICQEKKYYKDNNGVWHRCPKCNSEQVGPFVTYTDLLREYDE